jgi:hypothetical protein
MKTKLNNTYFYKHHGFVLKQEGSESFHMKRMLNIANYIHRSSFYYLRLLYVQNIEDVIGGNLCVIV